MFFTFVQVTTITSVSQTIINDKDLCHLPLEKNESFSSFPKIVFEIQTEDLEIYLVPTFPPPKFGTGFLTTLFLDEDELLEEDVSFSEVADIGLRAACASASFDLSFCLEISFS